MGLIVGRNRGVVYNWIRGRLIWSGGLVWWFVYCTMGKGVKGVGGRAFTAFFFFFGAGFLFSRPRAAALPKMYMYIQISSFSSLMVSPLLYQTYCSAHVFFPQSISEPLFFTTAPRRLRLQRPGLRRRSSPALTYPRQQL